MIQVKEWSAEKLRSEKQQDTGRIGAFALKYKKWRKTENGVLLRCLGENISKMVWVIDLVLAACDK